MNGQLAFRFAPGLEGNGSRLDRRREPRQPTVRQVEFSPFPRVAGDTQVRAGFTRDVSASGMVLDVEQALPTGALVRVVVRQVDGRPDFDAVARVAWSREPPRAAGPPRVWLGLALLAEVRRLARVPQRPGLSVRDAS